jgi:hypothetical protein
MMSGSLHFLKRLRIHPIYFALPAINNNYALQLLHDRMEKPSGRLR